MEENGYIWKEYDILDVEAIKNDMPKKLLLNPMQNSRSSKMMKGAVKNSV